MEEMYEYVSEETTPKNKSGLSEEDIMCYQAELSKLNEVFRSSDQRWEERIYQVAAGGLSLCIAAFSFLAGMVKDFTIDWRAFTIMVVYALVILINFLSQRLSVMVSSWLAGRLRERYESGVPYDSVGIRTLYKSKNRYIKAVYWIESVLLIADVACTVWFLWAAL